MASAGGAMANDRKPSDSGIFPEIFSDQFRLIRPIHRRMD
jgi:hypothetical protein